MPPKYFQQEADEVKFQALVTPFSVDWDDDGNEDIICGDSAGDIAFIKNLGGTDKPKWAAPELLTVGNEPIRITGGENGSIQGPCEAKWGYTIPCVADWDGDGLKDLIVTSIWGKVVWFKNIGTKGKPVLAPPQPITVEWSGKPQKPAWNWWDPNDNELVADMTQLAGSAAYARFSQSILWLESHDEKTSAVKTSCGTSQISHNRTLHLLKARNGKGQGMRLAFDFGGESLCLKELGIIVKKNEK